MRLFEHPEFEQAILAAERHFQGRRLRAAILEKDYFVTEALRALGQASGDRLIFKGGTSLSKGWDLIQRFSEDIDLFLDPLAFDPPLGAKAIDRELKRLRDVVARHAGMTFLREESQTIGGFGRSDRFGYQPHFESPGEMQPRVLLEVGTASGREPTETVQIRSYVGQFLTETGTTLGAVDEGGFPFRLLHFRRTFVEKLFAIHGKVEILKRDGRPIGAYARHYYDLAQLAERSEVRAMLASPEYDTIKADYDRISREHYSRDYSAPPDMRFAYSDAIFPFEALGRTLGAEYDRQCRSLCFGDFPSWTKVQAIFTDIRDLL